MSSPAHQDMLDELIVIARQVEAHRTAVWHLEQRQLEIRQVLIRSGWTAPNPEPEARV